MTNSHLDAYEDSVKNLRQKIRELAVACTAEAGVSSLLGFAFDPKLRMRNSPRETALLRKIK